MFCSHCVEESRGDRGDRGDHGGHGDRGGGADDDHGWVDAPMSIGASQFLVGRSPLLAATRIPATSSVMAGTRVAG